MEYLKKHGPLLLCIVIILSMGKCNYDGRAIIDDLEAQKKASVETELIYRAQNKELQLLNNKHLNDIATLKNEVSALKGEFKNIQKDEKEKLDRIDSYTAGDSYRFITNKYGK